MGEVKRRLLGEVITLALEEVAVEASDEYRIAGVYNFGRGLFGREPIQGTETSYRKLHRLTASTLVLSRLKAFEGALAVVPEQYDGWYLSPEFPTFRCIEGELDPGYLSHICRWPEFWSLLAASSKGIGARRERVHPQQLLAIELQLPPIDEQRRVAARLDGHRLHSVALETAVLARAPALTVLPRLLDSLFDLEHEDLILGDLITFEGETVHSTKAEELGFDFVGLEHIESHTGRAVGSSRPGKANGPKKLFEKGDITYARLRPYQNKVWLADRTGVTSSDQLILRPRNPSDGAALAVVLRSQFVLDQAIAMTSSLQLPRLRQANFAQLALKLPRDRSRFLYRSQSVTGSVLDLHLKHKQQARLAASYFPAALNDAFADLN